jgi:ribonuclease P/MRP protein subunit POP5
MKPRPPTLRQKKRYVLVRCVPSYLSWDGKSLYLAIAEAVASLYGDHGGAEIDQAVVAVEHAHAVVRCRRGEEGRLLAAIATVTEVDGRRCALHPRAVSGTIRSLRDRISPPPVPVDLDGDGTEGRPEKRLAIGACRVDVIEHDYKGERVVYFETITS